MARTNWVLAASASALLLAGCDDVETTTEAGQAGEPTETTDTTSPAEAEQQTETAEPGAADRFEQAIGEAVESTRQAAEEAGTAIREGVRDFGSEDAADLLRRGGEALGIAGEGASEYADRLAAQIEQGDASRLTVATSDEHGEYIANGEGRAVYMFEADTRGQGDTEAESTCYDDCAEAWPPLIVQDTPEAGEDLQSDLIDTIERRDGSMQVTYGGWPLYYFQRDEQPGDTTGHEVEGFGAEWYLTAPSGEAIHD